MDPLHTASTVTGPDSIPVTRAVYLDGRKSDPAPDGNNYSAHQRSPDGSSTFSLSDSDPALGLRAPVISSTTEFMGGSADVKKTTARTRSVVLSNPADLASAVQSFTETENVNSRTQPEKVEYSAAKFTTTSSAAQNGPHYRLTWSSLAQATNNDVANFSWDENGNLSTVLPLGVPEHTQTHTLLNQLFTYQPPALPATSVATSYAYTADRKLESMTNPDGLTTGWIYDPVTGKLTDVYDPGGNAHYDYFGPLENAAGQAPGRVKSITGPYGVDLSFNYLGRLTTLNKWTKSANDALIGSVGWSYNNDFARIAETITDSAGATKSIKFGYGDADGFLTCASLNDCSPPSTDSLSISHDSVNGLLEGVTFGSLTETYGYDNFGQLASKTAKFGSTALLRNEFDDLGTNLAYRRDALGRILRRKQTLGTTTPVPFDYTYSLEGRLTDVVKNGVTHEHYDYGTQNGNRSAAITPTLSVLATEVSYDDQDRLKTYGPYRYTYTNNGNLLTKTDTRTTPASVTTYAYDTVGNLVSVTPATGPVISYIVDGQNRRVAKKVGTATVKQWLYRDGLKPVAELDGAGTLVSIFVYGSNPLTPDLVVRDNATYRLLTDHVGSVVRAINVSNADVAFAAEYTAFGEQNVTTDAADFVPFGFAGGLFDAETGLVRFGARDYDPVVGRWTSNDPIGFDGQQANLYVYVGNEPVNHVDPTGLIDWDDMCQIRDTCWDECSRLTRDPVQFGACMVGCTLGTTIWEIRQPYRGKDNCAQECLPYLGKGAVFVGQGGFPYTNDLGGQWAFQACVIECRQ